MKSLTTILFLSLCIAIQAQTFELNDPVWRSYMVSNYPDEVDGNGNLILAKALDVDDKVEITNNALENIDGIQFMHSLKRIDIRSSKLEEVPALSDFPFITSVRFIDNNISSLPSLIDFPVLDNLILRKNKLSELPNLEGTIDLATIDASYNQLTTVSELNKQESLLLLNLNHNKLSSIPDLPLVESNLQQLSIGNNLLSNIPDISNYSNLAIFEVDSNYLTFEDLQIPAEHPNANSFVLFPQNIFGNDTVISKAIGESVTINCSIDDNHPSTSFDWYKDNIYLTTTTDPNLIINDLSVADAGVYSVTATNTSNSLFIGKTLQSANTTLTVTCVSFDDASITTTPLDCNKQGSLSIEHSFDVNYSPYEFTLANSSTEITFDKEINNLTSGNYTLTVENADGCTQLFNKPIIIDDKKIDCEPIIINPLIEGANQYYVEGTGTAQVLNRRGIIVNEFSLPGYFYGTDNSGQVLSNGLYFIKSNSTTTQVYISH